MQVKTPADLQRWLTDRNLHSKQLAQKLGVDASTVTRWLNGKRPIPPLLRWALTGIRHKAEPQPVACAYRKCNASWTGRRDKKYCNGSCKQREYFARQKEKSTLKKARRVKKL